MIFSIVVTILALSIMVCLHELGHMLAAKSFGVLVHEFSIGMGPKLFSIKPKETTYSVRLLLIGGYVQMEGENAPEEGEALHPRSFKLLKAWKKLIVLAAGAAINVIMGFVMFAVINMNTYVHPPVVTGVAEGYEAVSVFESGDEILKIDGTGIHTYTDVITKLAQPKVQEKDSVTVVVRRNKEKITLEAPLYESTEAKYLMLKFGMVNYSPGVFTSLRYAIYDTEYVVKAVVSAVGELISGKQSVSSLSGPVAIVSVVDDVSSAESEVALWLRLMSLFALISVNLGVFNLLPIPALDGGQILFVLIEKITGKEIKPQIVGVINAIFFVLLMLLAVYVTAGDIVGLIE